MLRGWGQPFCGGQQGHMPAAGWRGVGDDGTAAGVTDGSVSAGILVASPGGVYTASAFPLPQTRASGRLHAQPLG